MSEARDLVNKAADDARSCDDMASESGMMPTMMSEPEMESPLDHETFDERATPRMGERWEMPRRDAS